jgi:hypothetical protein
MVKKMEFHKKKTRKLDNYGQSCLFPYERVIDNQYQISAFLLIIYMSCTCYYFVQVITCKTRKLDNYGQSCFVKSDFLKIKCLCKTQIMMPPPDHKKL